MLKNNIELNIIDRVYIKDFHNNKVFSSQTTPIYIGANNFS